MGIRSTDIVSFRLLPDERTLVEMAADHAGSRVSAYIRSRVVEAAEMEILDRRRVNIPGAKWKTFETWEKAPAKDIPALRQLAATPPLWQD